MTKWKGIVALFEDPAFLVFFMAQTASLLLFLCYDHELKPEWKENIAAVCGEGRLSDTGGTLTPAQQTYGKVAYAMAYIGCIVGCIIESKLYAGQAASYSPNLICRSIDAVIAGLLCLPMIAGSFFVSKTTSFAF